MRQLEELQKPLDQFRASTRRLPIHPRERAVLWFVGAQLVFLPWAIGGMPEWAQRISFVVALLAFGTALLPREYDPEHTGTNRFRLIMLPRLVRFPLFWIGLALLGLVTVQALNPAWTYAVSPRGWWMQQTEHHHLLPSGVDVPFARWGPWRMLLIYASVWLTVCAVWVGVTRRRSMQVLISVIGANGLALSVAGIAQRLMGNGKMLGLWTPPAEGFFASFVYRNHAAAYLFLALIATGGLASWFYLRGLRRMEKSNPSGVFAFFATCIAVCILVTYARGLTLVTLVFLSLSIGAFLLHQTFVAREHRKPVVMFVLVLVFGYFLKTGIEALRSREAWTRTKTELAREDDSRAPREMARTAAAEMLRDNWKLGVGAGGFEFLFTTYQHRYPGLVGNGAVRWHWQHAHDDWLEIPIELGVPGVLLLALGLGSLGLLLLRRYFWENPLSGSVVLGLVLLLIYARWDFPFQNPAVLLTWCVLWVIATMWASFEEQQAKS